MANWLNSGKLIWKEDVVDWFRKCSKAFIGLMKGKKFWKIIIKVSE